MGKKKPVKKLKEVALSITEAEPPTTPRKRGRPRKIPEKNEESKHEEKSIRIQEVEGCVDSKNPEKVEEKVEEDEGSSSKLKKEQQEEPPLKKSRAKRKRAPCFCAFLINLDDNRYSQAT
ncbi:hypothetical protein F511_13664 [Dorcoceras hygrometricum]|uniref:Uncharacterized protein n=1 Tax=Dorcoceras hygrometricum TaxID=472368 RepID=A0A2Z7BAP2_9LAMI|nr:hypothetical protein F511_13664 [Dorcoceras hygrometricum]